MTPHKTFADIARTEPPSPAAIEVLNQLFLELAEVVTVKSPKEKILLHKCAEARAVALEILASLNSYDQQTWLGKYPWLIVVE